MNEKIKCLLKVIVFYALFFVLLLGFSFSKSFFSVKYEQLVFGVTGILAGFITIFIFLKRDKQSFASVELSIDSKTIVRFLKGVITGIVIMGAMLLFVLLYSRFRIAINPNSNIINFILGSLPLLFLAFMEELPLRGYALFTLKEKYNISSSILITALLFACSHLVYGWTLQNAFLGAGVWGILYGLVAIRFNGIAMPTGLHYAANMTTAAIAADDKSFNLWVLRTSNGAHLENYEQTWITTLLPNLVFLVVVLFVLFLYEKRKPASRSNF